MAKPVSVSGRGQERIAFVRVEQRYTTLRTGLRSLAGVGVAYYVYKSFQQIAGHETSLALALSLAADFKFAATLTLAGGAAAWAVAERLLRQRKVEQLQGRIRELEQRIDPNRTTSGLTPRGQTHPKDKER